MTRHCGNEGDSNYAREQLIPGSAGSGESELHLSHFGETREFSTMAEEGAVKVCVRVRPLIQREKNKDQADSVSLCWKADGNSILQIDGTKSFSFDRVFHSDENTEEVYQEMAVPIINSAIQGYNGTIFAYGQTSSGKTYTMMGTNTSCGIIPQAIHDVFKVINEIPNREFLLRVSYMEIYNETVTDLLCDDRKKKPLEIREDMNRNVYVADLTEELVVLPQNVMDWIKKGEKNRHYGETKMNERSSRSHTIFRMIVESRERTGPANSENCDGAVMVSHLNLVDLAGSERASQTGAEGLRLKEGCNINRSLFILGQVIKKLSDGQAGGFINYRDSKLTRILQNSLGGNAKTVIICTITPVSFDETLSTLQFASTAKNMKNTPHVNEVLDDEALLKRYRKEILDLKKQLEELETSSETRAKPMAADERAQLLEEIKLLQIEKEERTRNLTKIVVIPSSHVSHEDLRAKRKRRVTWAPGKLANSLSSTDDFGIELNTSHISKRTKLSALQSLPEMDDSDVSEFDELSRTVDEGLFDIEWNPAIHLFHRERLFSCQTVSNESSQGLKQQSSASLSLEISPPKKELELKVESMENQLKLLVQEREAEIEQRDTLVMENSNLQQMIISKEQENSGIVKRLEMTVAELEQKLLAANKTNSSDYKPSCPSDSPDQLVEKQHPDSFEERAILEGKNAEMDSAWHDQVEASEAAGWQTELLSKHAEEKMVLEHKIMDLEDMIERMTSVQRQDNETQKCNEDFQESVQICEALMSEKENAFHELDIMREHFDSVVLENERLKHEINDLKVQLNEKKELSEFEMLEKEAQKEQELDLDAKSNELTAKTKLLNEKENQIAELEKLVEKLQKKVRNIDMSVSMGSAEKFCEEIIQLKQSLLDAETVTKDAQKESAFLRSENLDLKEKMGDLSNTYSQMEKEVKLYKGQLESEKGRYKKMQVDLQKELQYAFHENTKLNSLLDGKVPKDLLSRLDLERSINDLKKQLDKVIEEKSDLEKEIVVLSEYKMLPNKVERLKKQVCEMSEELCVITAEKNELNLTLTDKESQIKILNEELGKAKEDLASIQPKFVMVQQECLELKQHFEAAQEEHQMKINEINQKPEFTQDAACETTFEETGDNSKEFQHLADRILAIEQEKQKLQLTLEAVQSERDQLKMDLEENIEMSIQVQEELRNSIEDQKRTAEYIEDLKSQIRAQMGMNDSTHNSEMKLTSLMEDLQKETRDKESAVSEKDELQQRMTSELQHLEEQLKASEAAWKTLESEKCDVVQQLHDLQEAATALIQEKHQLQQIQESVKAERDHIQENFQTNVKQLASLMEDLQKETREKESVLFEKTELQQRMTSELQQLEEQLKASEAALKILEDEKCDFVQQLHDLREGTTALIQEKHQLLQTLESMKAERDQLQENVEMNIKLCSSLAEELQEKNKEKEQIMLEKTELQLRLTSEVQLLEGRLKSCETALKAVEDEKHESVQQLEVLQEVTKAFKEEKRELQQIQESLEAERDQLQENLELNITQVSSLAAELQHKTKEKEQIMLEKTEMNQRLMLEIRNLQDQLKASESALATLEGEKCNIVQQLNDLQEAAAAFTQEKHLLQQMQETVKEEGDQLKYDVQMNVEQETDIQERISSEMQQLEEHIKGSESPLKAENEKCEVGNQLHPLERAVVAVTEDKPEWQLMQESLKAERDQLKEDVQRKIEQLSYLGEELQQKSQEKEHIVLEKTELQQKLTSEVLQLKEQLGASDAALKTLEGEKCVVMQQFRDLQEANTTFAQQRHELQQVHESLKTERDQLKDDVRKNFEQLSSLAEELQQKTQENEHIVLEKTELQHRLTSEVQQLEEQLKASNSALKTLEDEKVKVVQQLQDLQQAAATFTQEKRGLQQMQDSLKAERDELKDALEKNIEQLVGVKDELRMTQESFEQQKYLIDELQEQISHSSLAIQNTAGIQITSPVEEKLSALMEELKQKKNEKEQVLLEKKEKEQRLSYEMKQLEERLNASESKLEAVEREKCAAVQKLEELQKFADDTTEEKNELERIHGTLRVEQDHLVEDVQKYRKQSIEMEDALKVTREELEEQKRQGDELRRQISASTLNIQANSIEIKSVLSMEQKMSSLMEDLDHKTKEKEQVLDEKKELEKRLTAEVQQLEERLSASASTLETVIAEKCAAVQRLHELQEAVTVLTHDKNVLQQMQENLQMERDQLSEDKQERFKQLSSLMEELQQKTNEKEQVLNEKRQLEQRLSSEMKELEERLKASESTLETVQFENHTSTQKLQEIQQGAADLTRQTIELEQVQVALRAERDQLTEELQRTNIQVVSLMEEVQQKDKEKEQVLHEKKELERLTSAMQVLENQLKASHSKLKTVEDEKCDAVQKIHDLQEVVVALTQERNELQRRQETLQIERDHLSEDVQKRLEQLSNLREEMQQKINEKEDILCEKKELEQRLSSETKQLEERLKASESALESLQLEKCVNTQRQQEVQDGASDLTNLTQLLAELEQAQTTLKAERDQLSEEIERNVTQISSLVEELQQTHKEKEQIMNSKKEIEHRMSSEVQLLEERLKACETMLETVEGEKCNYIQKLRDLLERLTSLTLEKKELQYIQKAIQTERDQLCGDFQKLSSLMEDLQRKIIEQEHFLGEGKELKQVNQTLVSDVQHLKKELHTTVSALECVKEENVKVLQNVQELQNEVAAASLERDQLYQEKESLLIERDQLQEDLKGNVELSIETQDELRKRQEDLKQQKKLEIELRNKIAELSICIEENSDKIQTAGSLENKLSSLMEELQQKISEQKQLIGEREDLMKAKQTVVFEMQRLEEQLIASLAALECAKVESSDTANKLQELQNEVTALTLERDGIYQAKEALEAERDQLKEDIKENVALSIETQDELKKMQEDLKKQKELDVELRNKIAELLVSIQEKSDKIETAESLEITLSSMKDAMLQETKEKEQLFAEREKLMQEHQNLTACVQQLEDQLKTSESRMETLRGKNNSEVAKLKEQMIIVTQEKDELHLINEAFSAEIDELKNKMHSNTDMLTKLLEDLNHMALEKEQVMNNKEQLEQGWFSEKKRLEERLKAGESELEKVEMEKCALTKKLQEYQDRAADFIQEKIELEHTQETSRAVIAQLSEDVEKNLRRSVEAEEALRIAQEELKQQKCHMDELQNQVEAYSLSLQEKSVALQTALSLEEKFEIELKNAKVEVLLVQQKLEEVNTLLAEKESRVTGLLNQLSSQDHLLSQHSQELRAEVNRNKDLSEQLVLLEEEIAALQAKQNKPASKTDDEIAKHIAILEDKNKQFKVLLEKFSCMFTEYNNYLDRFSQDLHKEVISQKELMDAVNASLSSTLSRPFERLKADNLKLNSQIQTVVNKLKFVCNTKVMDDQYALISNFQMDWSNAKKKQIDLELQCAQKHGSTWEAASEQLKKKELQCLDEFIQKSVLIQQLEMDLSEIEKGIESVLPDLQQELNARKEFMEWLHSFSETSSDAVKINAGLQEENKRLVQFILLQNEKLKTFGKFKTIKAKDYSKLCNELLQEKDENNKELLKILHNDALGGGGHIAVEENQRLFSKLHAAQEELKKSQIKIQNLEHELNEAQHDAKENEKKATSLEKQLAFELNKLQAKLGDREQNLKAALSEIQALQVKLETGCKPYMEEIDQLKTQLVKMSMEKTKLSKYTDQEIAFLKSSVEDKEEQIRKLREQLRRAYQDQDSTVVVEKQTSEPSNVALTCGGGSGIVQSTAVLIMKQEKANLERELVQQKKKYERLLRNEAQLKVENQKLKEATRNYLISPEEEASQKPIPTPSGKSEAPVGSKDQVPSKCHESATQETIILDSPKSSIFDSRSKALSLPRPTQFFDNSSFGTISDAKPTETVPEKDPNDECWFAPSKSEKAQECRPS
ncbi:centromere-associated protein E isoform X2 [Pleurodeles waltl]|uniref:centromere-associated protein E isoform X2 n=1 Tax=Pleurodeles waltl TaxID=8319 RepID=UPI0037096C99